MFGFHNKNNSAKSLNENNEEKISYYDAFNYIFNHREDLKFAMEFKYGSGIYCPFDTGYFFKTDFLLNLLSKHDFKFHFHNNMAYLSTNLENYKFSYNVIKIDEELSSSIKLSDDSKLIFEKIKAIINLINKIGDKIGSTNFISYYYYYCDDENEAIKNITSVVKIFDELRKLFFKLNSNCRKEIFKLNGINHDQIDKCLNEIVNN